MRSVDSKSICPSFISFKNCHKKTCDMNSSLINDYLPKGHFTFKRINDSSNLSDTKIRSIWFSSSRILFDTACWSLSFSLLKPRSHKLSPTSKWARKNEEIKKYRLNISLNAKIQSVFSISLQQKVSYFFPLNSCTDNLGSL